MVSQKWYLINNLDIQAVIGFFVLVRHATIRKLCFATATSDGVLTRKVQRLFQFIQFYCYPELLNEVEFVVTLYRNSSAATIYEKL